MIEFVTNAGRPNLILFVHGFTGGRDTWKNTEHGYFFDQLRTIEKIESNFDIACFEYFSKLTNLFPNANARLTGIRALLKRPFQKVEKNISINEIAALLRSQLRFQLSGYENIFIIAHSMGGLVTKAALIRDAELNSINRIRLVISLAVPHLGADLATYGKLLSNNQQIHDLAPLSELCPALNDSWVKLSDKPVIKYFYGTYDDVVKKHSAIGLENTEQDVIACDDTHLSICKPSGANSNLIKAIEHFLEEFLNGDSSRDKLEFQKLDHPEQFNDEYFVLKLLVADVHNAVVSHSKEHFLNAEYARKLFSSSADQKKLKDLYDRIRTLYQDSYGKYISNGESNSGLLVSEIHQKIIDEDSGYLKTALPLIHGLHKKGMLHQLANDLTNDIWWSETQSVPALDDLKAKLIALNHE
ncbi:GPI inositol-deacylase [Herbaspirillum sp. WGmk3]|uniref:ABC-three component system protein n=1 Tax=Herbaspirillum sp. WGmk3 TaxID=2919925 RepID=UPI0020913516|nr:ABC-three component system protein [Herbaspirillum sp. WGmk3]MCO4858844.1 GPI inositol-deacylase [Herbaspirillum sp. WGmk3]